MEKICKDCNQRLDVRRFYKHPDRKDGRFGVCIECMTRQRRSKAAHRFRFKIGDSLIIRLKSELHRGLHIIAIVTRLGRNTIAHDMDGTCHVVNPTEVRKVMREGVIIFERMHETDS